MSGEEREEKNQKDIGSVTDIALKDNSFFPSYSKTNKLITALYMVTDVMDKEEPLRSKLRTLATSVISDIYSTPDDTRNKIAEIMSFLDIASAVGLISDMNRNILKKEFIELQLSIQKHLEDVMGLSQFFSTGHKSESESTLSFSPEQKDQKGQQKGQPGKIGVQKGSTLMKAIGEVSDRNRRIIGKSDVSDLRQKRRNEIIKIIKQRGGGISITDIFNSLKNLNLIGQESEKTLQRELIQMLKDNVLYRTGSKRWSRYFVKN